MNPNPNKWIFVGLTIWALLQIPRLIAIPLIADILRGIDDPAWMYPAILDIVVAILSPLAVYLLWKKPSAGTWAFLLIYLVTSIIDHGDAVTASILTPTPQIFGGVEAGKAGNIVPSIQALIDATFILLLCKNKVKSHFIPQ